MYYINIGFYYLSLFMCEGKTYSEYIDIRAYVSCLDGTLI